METLHDFHRTHYCGRVDTSHMGTTVSVCGWVQRMRNLGGLIFIDLRDRTGLLQLAFDETTQASIFEKAAGVRGEYVLAATGVLRERTSKNPALPTGAVELAVTALRILAQSETPPFEILEESDVNDALRLKYRYLDLRRPNMQRTIALRHQISKATRDYFDQQGFYEIETPMLTKSTPEGARDYLVPSRVHPGKFYALPQSPQQYKQLLMLAGFDRYMQIVRCFRDEDLRADRQPEFTQIDLELSFADMNEIFEINEGFLKTLFRTILNVDIETPFRRIPYQEALTRFGSDKPDLRFDLELIDITSLVLSWGFHVFSRPAKEGGSVRLIRLPGGAKFSRRELDGLTDFVKTYQAKGLAWLKLTDGQAQSSFAKFITPEESSALLAAAGAGEGDLLLIVADPSDAIVLSALGALRCECARRLDLIPKDRYAFAWITEFPLLSFSEEEGRYVAVHHPFTAPMDEDLPLLYSDPAKARAKAYDVVLNGTELGGGSLRIFQTDLQTKLFSLLGFTEAEANARFGHLLEAFRYGAPPHGGIAYGLDRLVMLMTGADSIRDVIAFPKVQNASEPMTACPDVVDPVQLAELGICLADQK